MNKESYWRWGETNPVFVEIASDISVQDGDFLYLINGQVKPASLMKNETGWTATLADNQKLFAEYFLGVACQSKPSGTERKIRVATTGVFSVSCTSATYDFGTPVGPTHNSAQSAFENYRLATVNDVHQAIGRVVKKESSAVTTIEVEIVSTIMHGGLPYCKCTAAAVSSSSSSSGA